MVEPAIGGKVCGLGSHSGGSAVSLMTKKNQAKAQASAGLDRARQAAARTAPLAKTASATAKTASATAAQGAEAARGGATRRFAPCAQQPREWPAPRVDQAAQDVP